MLSEDQRRFVALVRANLILHNGYSFAVRKITGSGEPPRWFKVAVGEWLEDGWCLDCLFLRDLPRPWDAPEAALTARKNILDCILCPEVVVFDDS